MEIEYVPTVFRVWGESLNPYSNGMEIECQRGSSRSLSGGLNPYSNGMEIESSYLLRFQESILLAYLSYDLYFQPLKVLSVDFSQMPMSFRVKCGSFNRFDFATR